jgi:hypothetical protein
VILRRYVPESEVEEEDACDPTVNRCVRLNVGIIDHALDVTSVYFDDEVLHTDNVDTDVLEGAEESEELNFRLGMALFHFVPSDRAVAGWIA